MQVIATAGHVDHGKSTLVECLTGMQPDRWQQEKDRGLSIGLGFVWTTLPGAGDVAFVDVPGHRRFIGTTLAGLGPAAAVLFVVAADEGWQAQSGEHLAAVDALGIGNGLLVVTRSDLADPEPALAQAREHLAGTRLQRIGSCAVSAVTGAGMDRLRTHLVQLCRAMPAPAGTDTRLRLWGDRAFTLTGAGTVLTGTLAAGELRSGEIVNLAGRTALLEQVPVRALHRLGKPAETVTAPARVAVNLRGVALDQVRRGDALIRPGQWRLSDVLDVRLRLVDTHTGATRPTAASPPAQATLHLGTAAVPVHVRLLSAGLARLRLTWPLPVAAADRAILRDPGGRVNDREPAPLWAVEVLDAAPPEFTRRGQPAARAAQLNAQAGSTTLMDEVLRRGVLSFQDAATLGYDPDRASAQSLTRNAIEVLDRHFVRTLVLDQWRAAITAALAARRQSDPLDPALPVDTAQSAAGIPTRQATILLAEQLGLSHARGRLRATDSEPDLGEPGEHLAGILAELAEDPCAAPTLTRLKEAGLTAKHLAAAESVGRILLLPGPVVLAPDSPARAIAGLAGLPQPFTVSQARQRLNSNRRVVVPLLEHLDALGWTTRLDPAHRRVNQMPAI
ncbi:MAG: selenocysteine-specific translation elongation factor [Micrococcales bacterium]|nr:MAG: selenocysteine-specific translation elongation factor [Micrococcales bacterium]